MKFVCAASVLHGEEAFSTLGEVVVIPDGRITRQDVIDADALIVRSKTQVDEQLLSGSRVAFVATATAGFDHLDLAYLEENEIAWTASPGCNANSVAEYVFTSLLVLGRRSHLELAGKTLGIIGVGQVGRRVEAKALALGMEVLRNDPPRQAAGDPGPFTSLEETLRRSDVVTLHVPLNRRGVYATEHLADYLFFEVMKPGAVFLNACRGEVTDSDALHLALNQGVVRLAVLDVFENEPFVDCSLLTRADIVSPHIAGYSLEGLLNGTIMTYREASHFFEVESTWDASVHLPAKGTIKLDARGRHDEEVLEQAVRAAYKIEADDHRLRLATGQGDAPARAAHFVRLRVEYPERREFTSYRVEVQHGTPSLTTKLVGLGFQVEHTE